MKQLPAIEDAVEHGRFGEAVALLLEEWSASRAAVLSEAIEAVAARAPREEPPPLRTNKAFQERWLALAAANEPLTVSWLAATLTQRLDREGMLFNERLAEVSKHPDPRYAKALVTMIQDGRSEARWASEELIAALSAMGDERTKVAMTALVALDATDWAELLPKLPRVKAPAAAAVARLAKLTGSAGAPKPKPSGGGDPKALLDAVRAAPRDLEARAVLADRLQELGDPYGEFIALQLAELHGTATADTAKRADELLKANLKPWLGPLFPLVYRGRFRGGFLEEMELEGRWKTSEKGWAAITEDPGLATVRSIVEGKTTGDVLARFYRSKTMRAIDAVTISSKDVALALRDNPPPNLRSIDAVEFKRGSYTKQLQEHVVPLLDAVPTVERVGCAPEGIAVLQRARAFGQLKELSVRSWDGLKGQAARALLEALPKSLEVFHLVTNEPGDIVALLPQLPTHVTTIHLGARARLRRNGEDSVLELDVWHKVELDPTRRLIGRIPSVLDLVKKKKLVSRLEVLEHTDDYDRGLFDPSKWKGFDVRRTRVHESGLTRPYAFR